MYCAHMSYVSWTGEMKTKIRLTTVIIWQNYNQFDLFLLRRRTMAAAAMVAGLASGQWPRTRPVAALARVCAARRPAGTPSHHTEAVPRVMGQPIMRRA